MRVPGGDAARNRDHAEALVRQAAGDGAQVILLPELFELPYFCTEQDAAHFQLAQPFDAHPAVRQFSALAAELGVVLPISFFERAGQAFFNTVAMIDADGRVLGRYRKTHIPDGPGYNEKFYFTPGDTGFRVWPTRFGRIGLGICWDQWFPETARALALRGAEMLLYPSAIGSEPHDSTFDSSMHWQRVMQGHAGANLMPLAASNRVGVEVRRDFSQTYYGRSFIAGPTGVKIVDAVDAIDVCVTARFDLDAIAAQRVAWGLFRDRRPDCYASLLTSDGEGPGREAGVA